MQNTSNQNYCSRPWNEVYFEGDFIGPCCNNTYLFKGSIDEYYRSKELIELKSFFQSNKKHESCTSCWVAEKSGSPSPRSNTVINSDILNISLNITNTCNFKCRMCGPRHSSSWSSDAKALKIKKSEPFYLSTSISILDWVIEQCKTNQVNLLIQGGEPLFSNEFIYLLSAFEKLNIYKNINLQLTSNLSKTKFKKVNYYNIFKKFRSVEISASIDGIGKVGEYIRTGFKQDTFDKNLAIFKPFVTQFSFTFQIYNVFHVPEFFEYANFHKIPVKVCWLTGPKYLSVNALSKIDRKNILLSYKEKKFFNPSFLNKLVTNFYYQSQSDKFWEYTESLDKLWGKSWKHSIPEIGTLLND